MVDISSDERFLATIGMDKKLVVWDLLSGCIVVTKSGLKAEHVCACWGGRKVTQQSHSNHIVIT